MTIPKIKAKDFSLLIIGSSDILMVWLMMIGVKKVKTVEMKEKRAAFKKNPKINAFCTFISKENSFVQRITFVFVLFPSLRIEFEVFH